MRTFPKRGFFTLILTIHDFLVNLTSRVAFSDKYNGKRCGEGEGELNVLKLFFIFLLTATKFRRKEKPLTSNQFKFPLNPTTL